MITFLDINKAINNKIKSMIVNTEFSQVPIVAEDVTEPIVRPSFKVSVESKCGNFNSVCREKSVTVQIYFFAKDRYKYKVENSKIQDLLQDGLLDGIYLNGSHISIDEVECDIVDTVLVCEFEMYLLEEIQEDLSNVETIGELSINL